MVFKKETEGDVTSVKDAKIAVYSCPFDGMITETKVGRFQKLKVKIWDCPSRLFYNFKVLR